MAEYTLPPDLDAFAEACGDAALPAFQGADFNADPSAAFSEGMGAAMDFMIDAGMPPDMCNMIQDICQGGFDQHMASNPDASPMDAFDAVGSAVDMYMADFPADMPCSGTLVSNLSRPCLNRRRNHSLLVVFSIFHIFEVSATPRA